MNQDAATHKRPLKLVVKDLETIIEAPGIDYGDIETLTNSLKTIGQVIAKLAETRTTQDGRSE